MSTLSPDVDIYTTPVLQPPDGVTSDFSRPLSSVQLATIIVFSVTYFFATASLAIRYVTSVAVVRALEPDVVLITLAWGCSMGYFISVCFAMKYGWGSDAWDISINDLTGYYNYLLPTTLTYMWSPTLSKLSILSVLWRISSVQHFRLGVYIVSGMLLIYTITFTGLLSGPCNPKNVGGGTCLNNLAISQVVLNISTDLAIIILPIPTLYMLQMPFRKKVVAGAIMSLGSAVLLASVARAPYVKIMATDPNFSRRQAEAGVWSLVELNLGILCSNLMRMKPFLRAYLPKLLTILGLSSGSASNTPGHDMSTGHWSRRSHSRGYKLHSVGNENSQSKSMDAKNPNGIAVNINMQKPEKARPHRDDESTDSILGG
ncbi:unnamed protein product [Clonostachys rosea]|uniref:Rhodopsin domain-containing protein n=1 Tax=Bionectria ochroleuca TaxID=29856 RepID=A0ABY6V4W9_BIOOC|nr:unnamed protein product [Clonostachys rosea]